MKSEKSHENLKSILCNSQSLKCKIDIYPSFEVIILNYKTVQIFLNIAKSPINRRY